MVMTEFPNIKRLGLDSKLVYSTIEGEGVSIINNQFIQAEDLENYLAKAPVVYTHSKAEKPAYWGPREQGQFDDTHTALLVGIEQALGAE